MKTEDERKTEFLVGLAELTRKTGIKIGGCGCHSSPFLEMLKPEQFDERAGYAYGDHGEVLWVSPVNLYDWKHFSDAIFCANDLGDTND